VRLRWAMAEFVSFLMVFGGAVAIVIFIFAG
jgi:hypothetical protein